MQVLSSAPPKARSLRVWTKAPQSMFLITTVEGLGYLDIPPRPVQRDSGYLLLRWDSDCWIMMLLTAVVSIH